MGVCVSDASAYDPVERSLKEPLGTLALVWLMCVEPGATNA